MNRIAKRLAKRRGQRQRRRDRMQYSFLPYQFHFEWKPLFTGYWDLNLGDAG